MIDESDRRGFGPESINPETLKKIVGISTQILGIDPSLKEESTFLNDEIFVSCRNDGSINGSINEGEILITFPPDEGRFVDLYAVSKGRILLFHISEEDFNFSFDRVDQVIKEQEILGLSRCDENNAQELLSRLELSHEHIINDNHVEDPLIRDQSIQFVESDECSWGTVYTIHLVNGQILVVNVVKSKIPTQEQEGDIMGRLLGKIKGQENKWDIMFTEGGISRETLLSKKQSLGGSGVLELPDLIGMSRRKFKLLVEHEGLSGIAIVQLNILHMLSSLGQMKALSPSRYNCITGGGTTEGISDYVQLRIQQLLPDTLTGQDIKKFLTEVASSPDALKSWMTQGEMVYKRIHDINAIILKFLCGAVISEGKNVYLVATESDLHGLFSMFNGGKINGIHLSVINPEFIELALSQD